MKLYTYTMERSLPRMALKGMPEGFSLYASASQAAEMAEMDSTPKDPVVVLEVDADGLDEIMVISGDEVEAQASMAQEEFEDERKPGTVTEEQAHKAYEDVYGRAESISNLREALDFADWVENRDIIPTKRITVLGHPGEVQYPEDDLDAEGTVSFDEKPRPLSAFKQPFVSRLLRSIFLPQHKLYGAGKRGPAMGFLSRFLPKREGVDVDEPPPDVVGGVPLVWAAGKTFRRGMRGAFGKEAGDAIAQLVILRVGEEPGKLLGHGAKGAVYALSRGRALKVTMDGYEVASATHLKGVRHPNLSFIHDAFVVSDGERGVGIVVRDAIDTTLDRFDRDAADALDAIMDRVLESSAGKVEPNTKSFKDVDLKVVAQEVENAIQFLREDGCELDESLLLDVADAFRALQYFGILGIDFDSKNVGVVKRPKPRVVVFDYGLTKSPPVDVEIVSLSEARR